MTDDPEQSNGANVDAGPDPDREFEDALAEARGRLDGDAVTAFYLGVVRDGEEIDSTFSYRTGDPQQEGLQSLSLLATHLRVIAREAGVDVETVAEDATRLATQVDEIPREE